MNKQTTIEADGPTLVARKSLAQHSPMDDEETTAFIEGWNAALGDEQDFDLALHFWNRRRCGI